MTFLHEAKAFKEILHFLQIENMYVHIQIRIKLHKYENIVECNEYSNESKFHFKSSVL